MSLENFLGRLIGDFHSYSSDVQIVFLFLLFMGSCFCIYLRYKECSKFSFGTMFIERERHRRIKEIMMERLIESKSSRISWFRLHNGEKDAMGICFKRCSCFEEIVQEGVSREKNSLQKIPCELVFPWLDEFNKGHAISHDITEYIKDERNPLYYPDTYYCLLEQGVKHIIAAPIKNGNLIFGFVVLDYIYPVKFSSDEINEIKANLVTDSNRIRNLILKYDNIFLRIKRWLF